MKPTSGPTLCSLCMPSSIDPNQVSQACTPNPITTQHYLPGQDTISDHDSGEAHIPANNLEQTYNSDPESSPLSTPVAPDQPSTRPSTSSHPMTTRSKADIFKNKHQADLASLATHPLHVALVATTEPRGFKSAAKDPKWLAAMNEEFQALQYNRAWVLVPRPRSANIVGSKWVYRIKYNSDGTIERHKARLVTQGYTQIPRLDYCYTLSPVVKASTVRIVLSLAVLHKWKLHQLDIKNAFLNSQLDETIFMEQPPGCLNYQYPDHVCKLSKALYGLKQAPRAWFKRLSTFLLSYGFTCSRADTFLFVFTRDTYIMYILVYVNDLILTGNEESVVTSESRICHQRPWRS
ncbi:retrovirus-related pol polyprotein from transposon RE1 [Tanacetum coccineum]